MSLPVLGLVTDSRWLKFFPGPDPWNPNILSYPILIDNRPGIWPGLYIYIEEGPLNRCRHVSGLITSILSEFKKHLNEPIKCFLDSKDRSFFWLAKLHKLRPRRMGGKGRFHDVVQFRKRQFVVQVEPSDVEVAIQKD
jgi:hypothetical protein